jgi:hypothetical protein
MEIETICGNCGNTFLKSKTLITLGHKIGRLIFYCSKKCISESNRIKFSKYEPIERVCLYCKKTFISSTKPKARKCCTRKCAANCAQSFLIYDRPKKLNNIKEFKNRKVYKPSLKIFKPKVKKEHVLICVVCKNEFIGKKKTLKTCSEKCLRILRCEGARKAGRASAKIQSETRRSKNEKLFCELCETYFKNVENNKSIFNGWDADVIVHDAKIAVLWNGKWHYKKLTKKHSVEQVQNRDKIKIKEIKNFGYTPYIIKDMGKFNPSFVEEKFKEFLKNLCRID